MMSTQRKPRTSYVRRRGILACEVCRARRTRCDGQRPRCSFCQSHDAECVYRQPPESQPSILEQELANIRQRLDCLTAALMPQEQQRQHASPTQQTSSNQLHNQNPLDHELPLDFPFMTIKTRSLMTILGLDPKLSASLYHLEGSHGSTPSRIASDSRVLVLPYQKTINALQAFAENVHVWYPILHPKFTNQFLEAISGALAPSSESCLVLLVAAIGFLFEDGPEQQQYACPFQMARSMLLTILEEDSTRSAQCLVLFSIYYSCRTMPRQAYDYGIIASVKVQNLIKNSIRPDLDEWAVLNRVYWATLLIESELSNQLDLAESGVWKLVRDDSYDVPLPDNREVWGFGPLVGVESAAPTSPESMASAGGTTRKSDELLSYFLAEIAMRRMLQRCTSSVAYDPDGQVVYAPIIANELKRQLEEWYECLPSTLRFDRCGIPEGEAGPQSALVGFLQTQTYAYEVSVYWPAVYRAIETGIADSELLVYTGLFFQSYIHFMSVAAVTARQCPPNTWTLYASIFVISMAVVKARDSACLQTVVPVELVGCLDGALQALHQARELSPSLAYLHRLLGERVGDLESRGYEFEFEGS